MEKKKGKSNNLIKTILFLVIVLLTCLLFFGLGSEKKEDLELVSFGFFMFSEVVLYIMTLLPSLVETKSLSSSDITSVGFLYLITSLFINFIIIINPMRTLVVINIASILVYIILFLIILLNKRKR